MYIAFYKTYRLTIASYVLIRDRELTRFWIQTSNIAEVHMVMSCLLFCQPIKSCIIMHTTLEKLKGHICMGLSVRASVRPCVHSKF